MSENLNLFAFVDDFIFLEVQGLDCLAIQKSVCEYPNLFAFVHDQRCQIFFFLEKLFISGKKTFYTLIN